MYPKWLFLFNAGFVILKLNPELTFILRNLPQNRWRITKDRKRISPRCREIRAKEENFSVTVERKVHTRVPRRGLGAEKHRRGETLRERQASTQ